MPATPRRMKVTERHHAQVGKKLKLLLDYLSANQEAVLEELLQIVYDEGRSKGYQDGNPNWDED